MLTTPGGQLGLPEDVREEQRRQRRRLGRLEHDGVPGRERGRDLPGEHEQREVPRDDLPGDADRPRPAVRERVLELVGPARVVEEVRRGEREVDVARLADRLAAVERLEHGELARALLQDPRDAEEVLRALARRAGPTSRWRTHRARLRRRGRRPRRRRRRPRRAAPRRAGRRSAANSPERGSTHSPPTKRP